MRTEFETEMRFTGATDDCPHPERWHSRDIQATEIEVSVLLGALCTALRPFRVLETGSYEGDSTVAMGDALLGWGHLDSLEIDPDRAQRSRERVHHLPVLVHNVHSLEFDGSDYDFMFFDSDPNVRPLEIRKYAKPGAVWTLHDAKWGEVQDSLEELRRDGVIDTWVTFPTPRGLALGRYPRRRNDV